MTSEDTNTEMPSPNGASQKPMPCSLGQKRFWFLEQFEPGNPALNIGVRWRLEGTVSDAAITAAFQTLLARHEILRTTFVEIDGEPHQSIADRVDAKPSFVDLTRLQPSVRQTEADRISAQDAQRSIDIRKDIPIRLTSLRLDERSVMILLSMHHIASDGASMGIIAHEFGLLVTAEMKGRDITLPPLELQFADYALWQADMVESGAFEEPGGYWSRKLGDMPYFEVPGDRPRPPKLGTESDFRFRVMSPDVVAAFEAAPPTFGRTLFDISATALARMLYAWTGRADVSIGTQVAGRDDVILEPMVGLFINTVVLRFDMAAAETARDLVAHAGAVIDDAMAHRQFPFEMLVHRLNPPRDPSRTPLFSVNYTLIRPVIRSERYDDIDLVSLPSQPTGAQYDLTFFLVKRADGWRLTCESSRALYDTSTVDRMLELWEAILGEMLQHPDARLQVRRPPEIADTTGSADRSGDTFEGSDDKVEQIRAIWSDVLKQTAITDSTHFFEAGGHSLLALRLLSRVRTVTGSTLPVAVLFQHPRFDGFVEAVTGRAPKATPSPAIVPAAAPEAVPAADVSRASLHDMDGAHGDDRQISLINDGGSKPPVIALNDGAIYHAVARIFEDRPFIDINVAEGQAANGLASKSFESFGRDAVRLVRRAQPHGPYTLVGHCVFGALAFEVAQQLRRDGETVSMVVMLDTLAPGYVEDMPRRDRTLRKLSMAHYSVIHFFELLGKVRRGEMSTAGLLFQYGFIRRNGLARVLERAGLAEKVDDGSEDYAQIVFGNQLLDARRRYRCSPYDGDVIQFRAMTAREGRLFDRGFGWSRILRGRYEIVVVPSDHFNMMKEPSATVVGQVLSQRLREIEARNAVDAK